MSRARAESKRSSSSPSSKKDSEERGDTPSSTSSSTQGQGPLRTAAPAVGLGTGDRSTQDGLGLQPKLTVNEPDDKYEREAERVADAVMQMPDPESTVDTQEEVTSDRIQRMCPRCRRRHRQGKPLDCEECEQELQRKPERDGVPVAEGLEQAAAVAADPGEPLSDHTRSFFETRMRRDFSEVRVHTGAKADLAARSVNSRAYTLGSDIVFRAGEHRPSTQEGKRLLAHELTHVMQQEGRTKGERIQRQGGEESMSAREVKDLILEATSGLGTSEKKILTTLRQADKSTLRRLITDFPKVKEWIGAELSGETRKRALALLPLKTGTVEECCRDVETGTFWDKLTSAVGAQHCWIKTTKKEAGMGPAQGGELPLNPIGIETEITDQSKYDADTCTTWKKVDERCVNQELQIGKSTGDWTPWNNCNTFNDSIIEKCDMEAYGDIFNSPFW